MGVAGSRVITAAVHSEHVSAASVSSREIDRCERQALGQVDQIELNTSEDIPAISRENARTPANAHLQIAVSRVSQHARLLKTRHRQAVRRRRYQHSQRLPRGLRAVTAESRSPSPEEFISPGSESDALEWCRRKRAPRDLGDTVLRLETGYGPHHEPAHMDIADSNLVQWIASIHAAGDDPLEGFVDAPEAPEIARSQQEVNRDLIEKALAHLRGLVSDPTFQEKDLQEPFVRSALHGPHHRFRDAVLPWQVKHDFAGQRSASASVEPDHPRTTAADRGRKRPHSGDDSASLKRRKRIRRVQSDDVVENGRFTLQPADSRGRQRILVGIWPRDGFHGSLRKGDLVRRMT